MTLRTTTLSAIAALAFGISGAALAQDSQTTPPADPQEGAATEAPATEAPAAEEAPAADATATEPAATDQPAEAEATEAAPATEEPPAAEEEGLPEGATEETEEAPVADAEEAASAEETIPDVTEEAAEEDAAAEPEPAAEEAPAEEEPAAEAEAAAEETPAVEEEAAAEEEPAATEEAAAAEGEAEHAEEGEEGESADHGGGHIEDITFSFEGPLGKYDQFQLQRGLQVYTEVCSACHGMKQVPLRTLADEGGPGLPEDQVRAYAAAMTIIDPETGEERPREPTDHFPTVSGDGMGPDLSLMAKARAGFHGPYGTGLAQLFKGIGGPEYIHAILTSYTGEEEEQAGTVLYGNSAFSTGSISMPAPLSDDLVTYEDGTPATVDQMARDVSAFLMWTAEPKMMARKQVGLVAVVFLILLAGLLYMTNKRLWAPHKGKH